MKNILTKFNIIETINEHLYVIQTELGRQLNIIFSDGTNIPITTRYWLIPQTHVNKGYTDELNIAFKPFVWLGWYHDKYKAYGDGSKYVDYDHEEAIANNNIGTSAFDCVETLTEYKCIYIDEPFLTTYKNYFGHALPQIVLDYEYRIETEFLARKGLRDYCVTNAETNEPIEDKAYYKEKNLPLPFNQKYRKQRYEKANTGYYHADFYDGEHPDGEIIYEYRRKPVYVDNIFNHDKTYYQPSCFINYKNKTVTALEYTSSGRNIARELGYEFIERTADKPYPLVDPCKGIENETLFNL